MVAVYVHLLYSIRRLGAVDSINVLISLIMSPIMMETEWTCISKLYDTGIHSLSWQVCVL